MSAWNFDKLQREIVSRGIKTESGTFYPQEIVDRLFEIIARSIPVDEEFYRANNPDIDEALKAGDISSAAQHFVEHGFYEDRLPCSVLINEEDYLARYPDVAAGIDDGSIASATDHWLQYGRYEGRSAYLLQRKQSRPDNRRLANTRANADAAMA
ncbi:hypothetical protein BB934_15915 [Microvirga ossetica]|uniref:Uncharacterized protein n=1 Tax=Microvirga ossetica TaxID=1882682 RepID=A0A1B2EHQ1_9HYPH|nr:hypothetical protein [Microvirga ossetica]ANY79525.1 hypothetical protein BB934_15915 [Microvirga ossetica]